MRLVVVEFMNYVGFEVLKVVVMKSAILLI
jgi:hypothetical protein